MKRARDVQPGRAREPHDQAGTTRPDRADPSAPQRSPIAGELLRLGQAAGNGAVCMLLQRTPTAPLPFVRGKVLVLGIYSGPKGEPLFEYLLDEAARDTGLRPMMMGGMESQDDWRKLAEQQPKSLASSTLVQDALEGNDGIQAIHIDTSRVPLLAQEGVGTWTAAEYRSLVASMAAGTSKVDIYIRHKGGLSIVRAGSRVVEGAPLPAELRPHLPPSFVTEGPAGPVGEGGAGGAGVGMGKEPGVASPGVTGEVPTPEVPVLTDGVPAETGGATIGVGEGAAMGAFAVGQILAIAFWLLDLWEADENAKSMRKEVQDALIALWPQIQAELHKHDLELDALSHQVTEGQVVYANISFQVDPDPPGQGSYDPDPEAHQPRAYLVGISLSTKNVSQVDTGAVHSFVVSLPLYKQEVDVPSSRGRGGESEQSASATGIAV